MPNQFQKYHGPDKLLFVRLVDDDGRIIIQCRGCIDSDCYNDCISSIRCAAAQDKLFERNSSVEGKWFFNLRSEEGKALATSRMHDTSYEMERSISAVKSIANE